MDKAGPPVLSVIPLNGTLDAVGPCTPGRVSLASFLRKGWGVCQETAHDP